MAEKTLSERCEFDLSKVRVNGRSPSDLKSASAPILGPEEVARRAGLGSGMYGNTFYNHNHCQYQRCVTRAN
ncbi:MAG: hypothetical protein AABY02_01640 [Nanoarchaeota archaeon]